MKDFLVFRKMISPILIQIAFWIAVVVFVLTAILDLIMHKANYIVAIEVLIFGPIAARIVAELLLVIFRIHENLKIIRIELTAKQSESSN